MLAAADVATTVVDPITIEIISHRLHQITKEIGTTLERVGGTVNTTQLHDYINALYRANGDVLSAGESSRWHVACAGVAVKRIIERFADDQGIDPGDMFLLNDPYVAAIHQPDVYIISPIHFQNRLVAWSATFVHVADIGALSPGGNSPNATEVFHEGVRIAGIKLVERGKVRQDIFDAICNMTRQPALVGLDLKCEIAANNVARARIQEVYAQYGADTVEAVAMEMIRYTEEVLRKRLLEIPDGSWRATGIIETSDSWPVQLELTKTGDHLLFDFTGSAPQAKVGVNLPYHATYGKCFGAVLTALAWDIPKNHGAFAPIEVIAPPGTVVNVQPPGPVSMNTTTGGSVVGYVTDVAVTQMVASSDKWRAEVTAKGQGHRRARHAGVNQHGWYYVAHFGGAGGSGARALADGIDCGSHDHNVEWFEDNYPFLYLFRRQILDGGGAGMFRGGTGQVMGITLHDAPEGHIRCIPFGVAGLRNSGQGLFGGYPGAPSTLFLAKQIPLPDHFAAGTPPVHPSDFAGTATSLPYREFELAPNDVLISSDSSGGGYGDPLDRDPGAVAEDLLQGLVTPEAARQVYGVVINAGRLDLAATERERHRLRQERSQGVDHRGATSLFAGRPIQPDSPDAIRDHPLRENLEIIQSAGTAWIRCARCMHLLAPKDAAWTELCNRKRLPPSSAGASMVPLEGQFVLEQLFCPSCAVLFETQVVATASGPGSTLVVPDHEAATARDEGSSLTQMRQTGGAGP
jgi:N-methylhydantoinase B